MSEIIFEDLMVGQPIRDQHGITCCPAIRQEDNTQFYIKTVRIPASAVQASGLLLSGAYENAQQVQEYYLSVAQEICNEAQALCDLQVGGGFIPFDSWDLEALESGVGYMLTLRSKRHKNIIDRDWSSQDAVNMALDLCNALTACRQKGLLYANLKPENVFMDENGGYCIGDLGFLPMGSLRYTALPEKYRSPYTAPEVADYYATASANMDVYALGMMLYCIYNENQLPTVELVPPLHCDYELWKIIATACHPDPLNRYEDPAQLGKALLDYQQNFGLSDEIIGQHIEEEPSQSNDDALFLSEQENDTMLADLLARIPDEQPPADVMDDLIDDESEYSDLEMTQILAQADDLISHQLPQPVVAPAVIDVQLPQPSEQTVIEELQTEDKMAESVITEEAPIEDESTEDAATEEPDAEIITEPEPETAMDTEDEEVWDAPKKTNIKKIAITLASILVALSLLITGAILYYNLIYTQHIDNITLSVKIDSVTVQIDSNIDDDALTVVCKPNFGETIRAGVKDGCSIIKGLSPNTNYIVYVEISGFHQLTGKTEEIFSTPDNVKVSGLDAVTDVWKGSVRLNFTATGNNAWIVRYFADGEDEKSVSFEGTEISITGLTIGKEYTFTLETVDGAPILGTYQVKHTVR